MSMIKDLWHGNILPQEDNRNNTKEMKQMLSYIVKHQEELTKTFTEEQKAIFEKFHDCFNKYMCIAEETIFEYAFKLGARLMLEVHKNTEE